MTETWVVQPGFGLSIWSLPHRTGGGRNAGGIFSNGGVNFLTGFMTTRCDSLLLEWYSHNQTAQWLISPRLTVLVDVFQFSDTCIGYPGFFFQHRYRKTWVAEVRMYLVAEYGRHGFSIIINIYNIKIIYIYNLMVDEHG